MDKRNTLFQIYPPESIKIRPGDIKKLILKYSFHLPSDILTTFLICPALGKEGLQLTRYSEINKDTRIVLECFNKTHHKTFHLRKN